MRDQRTDQRVRDRGGDDRLPSLTAVLEAGREAEVSAPDLLSSFAKAKRSAQTGPPDLMSAFERATHGGGERDDTDDSGRDFEGFDGPEAPTRDTTTQGRTRNADASGRAFHVICKRLSDLSPFVYVLGLLRSGRHRPGQPCDDSSNLPVSETRES